MTRKLVVSLGVSMLLILAVSCSQSPKQSPAGASPETAKSAAEPKPPEEVKVYDVSKEDITAIPGITSRNISVAGVKLGDRTRDVDHLLGNPIKMDTFPKLYRSAYDEHSIYVDIDRYAGKVVALYVNTNYYRKAKGNLSELLAHGSIDLLKSCFGDNPVESKPDTQTTMWAYPDKGIQFIHIQAEKTASYTLKLVEPKK
jgi:hypothetical protein